ncbi:MAG: 7-cyano-7-deazaguanine synthase QueC [Burkholderiaceae bacterium]|nr:7-cyano-7-deazaguanine synthase QueC [Burkholderiaceae bacterium]
MPTASPARSRAIVLFSGGQDSTTCVAWALERFESVETIGFDYGQRHAIELTCREPVLAGLRAMRPEWSSRLGADHLLDLTLLGQISETALTRDTEIEFERNGLPSTFVPGRNLIFLNFAAATAYRRGAGVLVGGMCETDFSGYPDCRDNTIKATQVALSLGLDMPMAIETPLMWIDKAATWQLAHTLGGEPLVELIREQTHTCYLGERTTRHPWGYGCGACPACALRARGHQTFLEHAPAPLARR